MNQSNTGKIKQYRKQKSKSSQVKKFALIAKPRYSTELEDWEYWQVKGLRGDIRAERVLVPKYLGHAWEIVILKNIQNGMRLKVWHWLDGSMTPTQYDKWKAARKGKRQKETYLLKLSIVHHDAFAQRQRLEGKPAKRVVKSLDVDPQNGSMGLDVALRSLRNFLLTYKYRKEVKKAYVWNMPINRYKQNKIVADFDFCYTISFRDKDFEKTIRNSVQYDAAEFGIPNYDLYGL